MHDDELRKTPGPGERDGVPPLTELPQLLLMSADREGMQVSGVGATMSSIAATAPSDLVTVAVLRKAMDSSTATMDALLAVLPDPDPSKGNRIDTYA